MLRFIRSKLDCIGFSVFLILSGDYLHFLKQHITQNSWNDKIFPETSIAVETMPPKIPGKKTFSVNVPDELYEALKSWAEMKEWSVSKAAWKLIEIGLDSETGNKKQPAKKSRASK